MKLELSEGLYVLAVSGGVDSVALLDLFARTYAGDANRHAIVAHFDHGIREDSADDANFVRALATKYAMTYACTSGNLGPSASEEEARNARYAFLRSVQRQYGARVILTAHHQDDLIETILLNCARGTGRQGLTPMRNTADIVRPLLGSTKNDVLQYAKTHALEWREDCTNESQQYTRNRMRKYAQTMQAENRQELLDIYDRMRAVNVEADMLTSELARYVLRTDGSIHRARFVLLEHAVACEVVVSLLSSMAVSVDRTTVSRAVLAIKTAQTGTRTDLNSGYFLLSSKNDVKILQK